MDKQHYDEMISSVHKLIESNELQDKHIYIFGHCNATEELIEILQEKGLDVCAILDNNMLKYGTYNKHIVIARPDYILEEKSSNVIVLIAARAYATMYKQLRSLGFKGEICKVVEYNSYAEYSLSDETIERMSARVDRGKIILDKINKSYNNPFLFLFPFAALGDVYIAMSYLPYFMKERGISNCVIAVIGKACAKVVDIFGGYKIEILSQKDMDEFIQASLHAEKENMFICHQDRPYVVNLHKALHIKKITLEQMYCCGVFKLPLDTKPCDPTNLKKYPLIEDIQRNKSVILSPYAKSVTLLPEVIWNDIVKYYASQGYQCYTNVAAEEKALVGTIPISPQISQMQSVVERAGIFIGIRSGMCDVIRNANAIKIALYPDYNYSDTKWKAIDIYSLDGWENIVVKDDFIWKRD